MAENSQCLNCQSELSGPFCSNCGQRAIVGNHRSFRYLMSTVFTEITSLDSRLLLSLRKLLFVPGALTRAYIDGQRKRYISAIGIFLMANLIFFLAPSLSDFSLVLGDQYNMQPYSPWIQPWIDSLVQQSGDDFAALAREYQLRSNEIAKTMVILHVPMLALVSFALGLHRKLYYADHVVMALHFMAFVMLYNTLMPYVIIPPLQGLDWLAGDRIPVWRTALALKFIYVPFMLRKAFGYHWLWVIPASALLLIGLYWAHVVYRFVQFALTAATL